MAGPVEKGLLARSPLHFSGYVLAISALFIIFFPIVARMNRVRRFRRVQLTGQLSSVAMRRRLEGLFGTLLLCIILVAALESFPRLSVYFHKISQGEVFIAFPTLASIVAGLVAANRMLPMLGGMAKKIAMVAIGLLGLMLPLLVVLFVVEFLVYSDWPKLIEEGWDTRLAWWLVGAPWFFSLMLAATWLIGIAQYTWRGHLKVIGLMLAMFLLGAILLAGALAVDWWLSEDPRLLFTYFVFAIAIEIMVYCWLSVDVNQTSINGLYRDSLASAYLVGVDTKGDIDIERDINLQEICNYDAGSTAPYHLINTALNLQATTDIGVRDRNSDFFMFSKRFIGSNRTGYCTSDHMEAVFPQVDLGTAMAISAAAASPNMGRGTNRLMVAFLTLLNIRLGFWVPHPDRLERYIEREKYKGKPGKAISFEADVFPEELREIEKRRTQVYGDPKARPVLYETQPWPTTAHGLVGLGCSGGGIRSATLNLGILQELHRRGVFEHIDYLSTVSGGGYVGSSISTLMRQKTSPHALTSGTISLPDPKSKTVIIQSDDKDRPADVHAFAPTATLDPDVVRDGARVKAGQRLLKRTEHDARGHMISIMESFSWRVRPSALRREMLSQLDENHNWLNLSDGGHIENLASMELLRRRCKFLFIGDAEADPKLHFSGLATLVRYARIDLGIEIAINVDEIRPKGKPGHSKSHWAVGEIRYPPDPDNPAVKGETGYLIYMKSSITGKEDEVIREYRDRNPSFPHESTADQLFDEGQFEAYRALGQDIAESLFRGAKGGADGTLRHADLEDWAADALAHSALMRLGLEGFERQGGQAALDSVDIK